MVRRAAAALAALLLTLGLLPASALAHATLQATIPERGAKLDKPPAQVTFRFDESVEASFGALRVFDSKGQEVQTGKAFHPGGKGSEMCIRDRPCRSGPPGPWNRRPAGRRSSPRPTRRSGT